MSDESTAVAAPEAPTTPTPDEATEAPQEGAREAQEGTEKPLSLRDVARRIEGRSKGLKEHERPKATKPNRAGEAQPVDEKGRYATKEGADSTEPAPETEEAAAPEAPTSETSEDPTSEASEDGAPETEADAPLPEVEWRELPEDHPWRERGIEKVPVLAGNEEYANWTVKNPVRVQEHRDLQSKLRQEADQRAQLEARIQFLENGGNRLTPEQEALYTDIKQTYDEARAEEYKAAVLKTAETELQSQTQAKRFETGVKQWRQHAIRDAAQNLPGWTPADAEVAMQRFALEFQMGRLGAKDWNVDNWRKFARTEWEKTPAGQKAMRQRNVEGNAKLAKSLEARAKKSASEEAKNAEQARLKEAAEKKAKNPMGSMPRAETGRRSPDASDSDRPKTFVGILDHLSRRSKGIKSR